MPWARVASAVFALLVVLHGVALAAVPVLDHLLPVALAPGASNGVTLVGKFDPWPPRFWSDLPGLSIEPSTNNGSVVLRVPAQASAGVHFLRAFNAEGASAPRFLIIDGASPLVAETEPNNDAAREAQPIRPPVVLQGRLEKNGDVDSVRVELEPGQSVVAWAQAYTLMSPMDPVLRLLDPRNVQVAWNHDDGRSLDPLLAWTATTGGPHVLQFFTFPYPADSDIRLSGKPHSVYRLHVHAGPVVRHALPLGVQRGARAPFRPVGWNLGAASNAPAAFDATKIPPGVATFPFHVQGRQALVDLIVGDGPEAMESEPNDDVAKAEPMDVPGGRTGNLDREGDIDRFQVTVRKGEKLVVAVQSAALGFALDGWVRVEDATGKELARNDDATGSDPRLEWTAPADGSYVVAVGSLLQLGGSDRWYHLSVARPVPSMRPTVTDHAFTVAAGKTNDIVVALGRVHGHDAPLSVSIEGLPTGVAALPVEAAGKDASVTLRVVAATNAAPASVPIRVQVKDAKDGRVTTVRMDLVSAGENNGVPQGFRRVVRDSIEDLWLTVTAPAK